MGILGGGPLLWAAISLASSPKGLRVNRALRATYSRRQVNRLIEAGRLSVNDVVVTSTDARLKDGDRVKLDGLLQVWEEADLPRHQYKKYHKPSGVVCPTDRRTKHNILDAFEQAVAVGGDSHVTNQRRVYPIGRLDAESSGLILLTSDGSIVNPLLRANAIKTKVYHVTTSPRATDDDIRELTRGVVITTCARKNGLDGVPITSRTLPGFVERIIHLCDADAKDDNSAEILRFSIKEGRNRQIRKMCSERGLSVTSLYRTEFSGITLGGCEASSTWADLTDRELICIGAKKAPTRNERRTPEERARRKLKKINKKRMRKFGY